MKTKNVIMKIKKLLNALVMGQFPAQPNVKIFFKDLTSTENVLSLLSHIHKYPNKCLFLYLSYAGRITRRSVKAD
jgi:hypothetical protein